MFNAHISSFAVTVRIVWSKVGVTDSHGAVQRVSQQRCSSVSSGSVELLADRSL